jgi:hypothetical protein
MAVTAASPLAPRAGSSSDAYVRVSLEILRRLTEGYSRPDFSFRFWDHSTWRPASLDPPSFTVVLHHSGALRNMFLSHSQLKLGEAT